MKRILSLFGVLFVLSMPIFAQSEEDGQNQEENIVREDNYAMNGKGDQFLKIGIMPNFPLNFGNQLSVGGAAQLGYYRFFNGWLGLGGELMAGYNPTLG